LKSPKDFVSGHKNFFVHAVGGTFGGPPGATVKNSDTLGRYSKKFRLLKEAKFLSEFFHSKLHAQCNLRQAEGGRQK